VIGPQQAAEVQDTELALSRRLRDLRLVASSLEGSLMTPLQVCEAIIENRFAHTQTRQFFSGLPEDEKHYWISSLYAILMPKARRRRLAAYFTPPHLAQYAIDVLIDAGIKPGTHNILDPASGGAAFLVPLAARIAGDARQRGVDAAIILSGIEKTLAGVEIEPHLASLSRALLADLLCDEIAAAGRNLNVPIKRANTLELQIPDHPYDAVIGNPPYGRVYRPSKALLKRFAHVITDGYVNLYALFIEQALRWIRPGGVVCLIVPISFVGGPYFAALRKHILETARVVSIDLIDKRSDVFLDVLYDVCVLVLEKKNGKKQFGHATSSLLLINEPPRELGSLDLPEFPSERIWALPDGTQDDRLFQDGLETLTDYGYLAKTGYFVWNREQHRYRTGYKPRASEVPLFWAHNVTPNATCEPHDGEVNCNRIGLVTIAKESSAVIHTDAVILQRTTNRRQRRRLIAGVIRQGKVPGQRGFVSENHTILVVPDPAKTQKLPLKVLCRLLNTAAVDARFRRISGTVSVSTKALRSLPLPAAREVRAAFAEGASDDETAEIAYTKSISDADRRALRAKRTAGGADGT
jgi:adenine-specific DNA-methyltransferase